MGRKREMNSYQQGMKAGAKPFSEKFDQISNELKMQRQHVQGLKNQQKKQGEVTDKIIIGMQQYEDSSNSLKRKMDESEKLLQSQKEKISQLELMMPTISTICSNCVRMLNAHQLVCSNCGLISRNFPYELSGFDVADECVEGVHDLANEIKASNYPDEDWVYSELEEKLVKMKKIRSLSSKLIKNDDNNDTIYKKIYNLSSTFFSKYRQHSRIEIAVVGTVKAGKSSLINSLIGTSLASVDPTPETSILVKYRTTEKGNYLRINFYTEKQWNELWRSTQGATVFRNEYERLQADRIKDQYLGKRETFIECSPEELPKLMMEWSKSDAPKHFFVKEIEVGYQSDTLPHDVYLVDTPGLSDPVRYRSDITRKYIKSSDWILACIVGENLSQQPEFNFLSKVISNKGGDVSKIFVVATKKDTLTTMELEKKKTEFLTRLGELYGNHAMAMNRFEFVAAECHLLTTKVLRDEELSDDEYQKIMMALPKIRLEYRDINDKSKLIFEYAGINSLFEKIDRIVLQNRRKYVINEITIDYTRCMRAINEIANSYIDAGEDFLEHLVDNHESSKEKIKILEESNREIIELQKKVQVLKTQLEEEIKAVSGK